MSNNSTLIWDFMEAKSNKAYMSIAFCLKNYF